MNIHALQVIAQAAFCHEVIPHGGIIDAWEDDIPILVTAVEVVVRVGLDGGESPGRDNLGSRTEELKTGEYDPPKSRLRRQEPETNSQQNMRTQGFDNKALMTF
jgi:hypothetical protein